jgi:hypothetical protein
MAKKRPLPDFRAVRRKLGPEAFAISEGVDVDPTDLVDEQTWFGITHLPDDVAIRTSDHSGLKLALLHSLWGDWLSAIGDPDDKHDELYGCMLDAADAFQCTTFLFLHGYYRAALAQLRVALELVMIGAYGNLKPTDPEYIEWKASGSDRGFNYFRDKMHDLLADDQCKWLVAKNEFPRETFRQLCNFTHSRPDSSDAALRNGSNGRVYIHEALTTTYLTAQSVYAICYLLVRIARPRFALPRTAGFCSRMTGCQTGAASPKHLSNSIRSAPSVARIPRTSDLRCHLDRPPHEGDRLSRDGSLILSDVRGLTLAIAC